MLFHPAVARVNGVMARSPIVFLLLCSCMLSAQQGGTGVYRGQRVIYQVIYGMAVAEGDIVLSRPEELAGSLLKATKENTWDAIVRRGEHSRWPNGVIPYVISDVVPDQQRIQDAIQHWQERTSIRLTLRQGEADYVRFVRPSVDGPCTSLVGRIGGEQAVNVPDSCTVPAVIHEIGHVVGLYHEQSRSDRDYYLRILGNNVEKNSVFQFTQRLSNGEDVGPFDYNSIMMYGRRAFSRNGRDTMAAIPLGIPLGNETGLSPGDIAAVQRLYDQAVPRHVTVTTNPPGQRVVDGEAVETPREFDWEPGSTHTLNAEERRESGDTRVIFARWSNDGPRSQSITVNANETHYTAHYVRQFRPALLAREGGSIRISPSSADGFYPEGADITLQALPTAGIPFAGWTGRFRLGHGGSENPITFTLRDPGIRYEAVFSRTPLISLTSNVTNAVVYVDNELYVLPQNFAFAQGSTHTIEVRDTTQSPNFGSVRYQFEGWSNGGAADHHRQWRRDH